MRRLLEGIATGASGWIELRYHARRSKRLVVRNGQVEESSSVELVGVGVRAFVDGAFGFASTTDLTETGIRRAVGIAQDTATIAAGAKRNRIEGIAKTGLASGEFPLRTDDPLDRHSLEEKLELVTRIDALVRSSSPLVVSSEVSYGEMLDEKVIVTSDGASAHVFDAKPALRVLAIAGKDGDQTRALETVGVTGGWSDLFAPRSPEETAECAVRLAVDQLAARPPTGGTAQVVLDPELVGLLSHEAIGHTVEADFVLGGAITAGKIGEIVASELVTMCDSGASEHVLHAVGELPVDDEGVPTERTVIIDNGTLKSYLHNRETAAHFGVAPTGNARAYTYADEPIIRMRNTYIEPGETPVEELIGGVKDGYYLRGLGQSGQADSNAEFMFGVREAWILRDGKRTDLVRGVTISGNAFEVLGSIDAVGDDFAWEQGSGFCGKGQPAKTDGGGPHVRCTLTIGGEQNG
ncbi:TldD/PmbA family protein [Candidatus Bipolaricaulota bacterium]